MLYQILVDKEACIFKLKKFVCEELKKPEYAENYMILEDQLNNILQDEDYDPRTEGIDISLLDRNMNAQPSQCGDATPNIKSLNTYSDVKENKIMEDIEKDGSDAGPTYDIESPGLLSLSEKHLSERSEEGQSPYAISRSVSTGYQRRSKISLTQKSKEVKKLAVTTLETETVTRRLFNFELELKEYCPPTFDAIKLLLRKKKLTAEEIHDQIEELADSTEKSKYFHKIFPIDTRDKIADELENYIFELLYPKLFVVDDDVRGHSQQFQDRLNVLKSFVTFEMLEIPVEMRKESLYTPAIKEMKKMTQFKAPIYKMQIFQNSVHHILNIFSDTVQRSPSSDELFPVLVYVVLQANIDLIKYTVDYIYTYIRKSHLMSQLGFLIVNLKAVIQFLQGVNGNSLFQGKLEMKKF